MKKFDSNKSADKTLADKKSLLSDYGSGKNYFEINLSLLKIQTILKPANIKRYFSEKNALTVMASLFCFVMMIVAIKNDGNLWEAIAFALAFSFSVELICHRTKEHK